MTIDDAVELVVSEVGKEQFQSTETSMKTVRNLHLASVVEIALMNNTDTYGLDLGVQADHGKGEVVIVRGPAAERTVSDDVIRAVATGVKGVERVGIE
jgi:hypothetical protein